MRNRHEDKTFLTRTGMPFDQACSWWGQSSPCHIGSPPTRGRGLASNKDTRTLNKILYPLPNIHFSSFLFNSRIFIATSTFIKVFPGKWPSFMVFSCLRVEYLITAWSLWAVTGVCRLWPSLWCDWAEPWTWRTPNNSSFRIFLKSGQSSQRRQVSCLAAHVRSQMREEDWDF